MTRRFRAISVRLDAGTERELRRLAHETGSTISSVVRDAVAHYGASYGRQPAGEVRPYDRLAPFIGAVSRHADRSERTGEGFRRIQQARVRARRTR
jgi:hypothetical protein